MNSMEGEIMGSKSFKNRDLACVNEESLTFREKKTADLESPRLVCELDSPATKLQKTYKSYRTRRNLADCAVLAEELWWKALDFAELSRSSLTFFNSNKSETAVSRWTRVKTKAAKLGKGLAKDEKAQKLALKHWLEAIDPRHRYGENLKKYYDVWFNSESHHPFFYWLDVGDGKGVDLETCPRTKLVNESIKYLGPKEREEYKVIVENEKLKYQESGLPVETPEGSKWIYVLSASRKLYVWEKKKGTFQHSSFLAGGAVISAGRLIAHNGLLEAIWSYSGHYRLPDESFVELVSFLEEQGIDTTTVKKYPMDDDIPPNYNGEKNEQLKAMSVANEVIHQNEESKKTQVPETVKPLSCKWTTGAGPRIGCIRQYPAKLQVQALEQVHLSTRANSSIAATRSCPIPSPRPSSRIHLSPRIMGISSPRSHVYKPKN